MYSADAKDEIARTRFERACCPAAFVRALAGFSARPSAGTDASRLIVRTERGAIARAALKAAKLAGVTAHAVHKPGTRFHDTQTVTVLGDVPFAAHARPPARNCCRRAWLRGAFLACGSVSDPAKGYHLELFCRDDLAARALTEGLAGLAIDASISRRRHRALVYVKGVQAVADLLAHMGATNAVLILDDLRALRETKNQIRRAVNGETANAARAGAAGARQREAAVAIIGTSRLKMLAPQLREAARLRIAHPDLTLAELAKRSKPTVTKATMGYRMRALERLARNARTD